MDPATKQIDVVGDIKVARTLASLGNSSAEPLRLSIEKDERNKSASPDPISLIDQLNRSIPKTSPPTQKYSPGSLLREQPISRELRPRNSVAPRDIAPKQPIIKMGDVAFQGVDLTSEAGQVEPISWREPHPIFVIVLVGPEEIPFGVQKDLLCAKAPFYRHEFARSGQDSLELIVKLPETTVDAFGCFQSFIYTGKVYDKDFGQDVPEYAMLLDVWKLATKLQIPPLRVAVLNAMADRRYLTSKIPGTMLLIQAWKETDHGSGLRMMLIGWAAEHMRANGEKRNEFARSLPQEILSELVITMSDLPATPALTPRPVKHNLPQEVFDAEPPRPAVKRARKSAADVIMTGPDADYDIKPIIKKQARKSEPNRRVTGSNRRVSTQVFPSADQDADFTPEKEMEYCRGLIDRMIQGPGFWTRLVGPFKNPVNPEVDQVPNYFDVVKHPMDLSTIKLKIINDQYATGAEFESDVRLIFANCYEYWTKNDGIWDTCVAFEKYFNEQWGNRHRWTGGKNKYIKAEIID